MVSILDLYAQKIIRDSHVPLERAPRGIPSLPDLEQEHVTYDDAQKEQEQLSIGIIGAGAAGLFIGMTLEKVNNYLLGRGVKPVNFEILEAESANGEHPIGGRLWTYQFSKSANDYYDRGAMRFPDNPTQQPVMDLFDEIGLKKQKIPYVMSIPANLNLFNSVVRTNAQIEAQASSGDFDPFFTRVKKLTAGVDDMVNDQVDRFRKALVDDFDKGWELLMQYDMWSTRGYMTIQGDPKPGKYSDQASPVVDYLETLSVGTGMFNQALAETVLDTLQFDFPTDFKWWTIQGGVSVIAEAMAKKIPSNKIVNGKRVTGLWPAIDLVPPPGPPGRPIPPVPKLVGVDVVVKGETQCRRYSHVVTTIPFGALRMVDTEYCHFSWDLQSAIRTLSYDSATKIGIKFKERWWEKPSSEEKTAAPQLGGVSKTDRPTRVVVYPSYGIGGSDATIIVSYTWAQDAARQSSFQGSKEKERLLIDVVLKDLADLHGIYDYTYLPSLLVDWDVWAWYNYENSVGAYAFFGPGQFARLYREVTKPAIEGRLHFAGEVTSPFHAWVLGAVRSASRALKEIFIKEIARNTFGVHGAKVLDIVTEAFDNPELDNDLITKQVALGIDRRLDLSTIHTARQNFAKAQAALA